MRFMERAIWHKRKVVEQKQWHSVVGIQLKVGLVILAER
jgi:hypothetical protein